MKLTNEMALFDVIIDSDYKDLLLVHIAELKAAHVKLKSEELHDKSEEKKDFLKENIKELRLSLNELFNKLDITESRFKELSTQRIEKQTFNAQNLDEIINHLSEEIDFYSNRVRELERYINKAKIRLDEMINLKITYLFLLKFDFSRESLLAFKNLSFKVYTTFTKNIPYLNSLFDFSEFPCVIQSSVISNERTGFIIVYPKDLESILKEKIGYIHAEEVPILKKYIDQDSINFNRINKEIDYIRENLVKYEKELNRISNDNLLKFAAIHEVIINLEEYNWAENQFEDLRTGRFRLKFFVPIFKKEEVSQNLVKIFRKHVIIETKDIGKRGLIKKDLDKIEKVLISSESSKKDERNPNQKEEQRLSDKIRKETPTMMKHGRLTRPFETLTRMYGTPSYSEIDPTPFLFITFPLLFGIMFGDIGHGLVLVIAGLIGTRVFKTRGGDIYNFSWIVFWCGLWAMLGGTLYGEFFGSEEILGFHLQPISIPIPFLGSFTFYDPLSNVMNIFVLTLVIGVLHINLGWILQMVNLGKEKKKYQAFTESLMKIFFLDGGIILIFVWGIDLNAWMAPPIPPVLLVLIPGLMLVLFKPLGKLFKVSYMKDHSYGALVGEGSMETFETVLSVPSNALSYIRLLALLLAHVSLMVAIRAMVELVPGQEALIVQIIVIFALIMGNIVVILLEGILVFLNAIRLHFYEFFFKFYTGSGTEFIPFVLEENFSILKFNLSSAKDLISSEIDKEIETQKTKDDIEGAREFITKKFF